MTKHEFDELPVGTTVWFRPRYFAFAMPATVKVFGKGDDAVKGIWINFFGDGQCFFSQGVCSEETFYSWITKSVK